MVTKANPYSPYPSEELALFLGFFKQCSAFSYRIVPIKYSEDASMLNLMMMDCIPHLRRSNYCDDSFEHVKTSLNCYGFACRVAGVAEPGGLFVERIRLSILKQIENKYSQDQEIREILKPSTYWKHNSIHKLNEILKLFKTRTGINQKNEELNFFNSILQQEGQILRNLNKSTAKEVNLEYLTIELTPTDENNDLDKLLESDGLIPLSKVKNKVGHLIAAFQEPGDFHFFRLEADGWWNCIPGFGIRRETEDCYIPDKYQVEYFKLASSFTFVGYFIVPFNTLVFDRHGNQPLKEEIKLSLASKLQIINGDINLLTKQEMRKAGSLS